MFLAEGKKNGPMWIRFSGRMKRMARRGGVETLPGKLTRVKKKKGEEEKKNNGEGQRGGWNQLALKTGGVTLEKKKEGGRRGGKYYFPVHQEEMNFRLGVWKERS